MKKTLLTVSALGLGLALTASVAAAEMSFTAAGKYNITGMFLSAGDASSAGMKAGPIADGTDENVDMWHHSMYLYPTLQVNDNIKLIGELRFIDRDVLGKLVNTASDENMRVFKLWMEWMSPVGTVSMGRMPGGQWGSAFLDTSKNADRIKWASTFNGVGAYIIYQKDVEEDAYWGWTNEADKATYIPGISFTSDIGKTDLAAAITIADQDAGDYTTTELWFNGKYSFGAIGLTAEAKYAMGETSDGSGGVDDVSSFAAMLDVNTKIDSMTAGLLFFYAQGDLDSDGDNEGYTTQSGFGNDFNPFLIATGDYYGFLNGDKNNYLSALELDDTSTGVNGNGSNPGALALAVYGVYPVSDVLTINAALGHIWADESGTYDDAIGWEFDIGMSYKLLDNLTYSAQLGYLAPGDMIDDLIADPSGSWGSTYSSNNILALVHSLTMTF